METTLKSLPIILARIQTRDPHLIIPRDPDRGGQGGFFSIIPYAEALYVRAATFLPRHICINLGKLPRTPDQHRPRFQGPKPMILANAHLSSHLLQGHCYQYPLGNGLEPALCSLVGTHATGIPFPETHQPGKCCRTASTSSAGGSGVADGTGTFFVATGKPG